MPARKDVSSKEQEGIRDVYLDWVVETIQKVETGIQRAFEDYNSIGSGSDSPQTPAPVEVVQDNPPSPDV